MSSRIVLEVKTRRTVRAGDSVTITPMAAIPLIIENQHDGQWYVIDLPDNWVPQGGVITISVTDQPFPTRNAAQHERAKRTQARRR